LKESTVYNYSYLSKEHSSEASIRQSSLAFLPTQEMSTGQVTLRCLVTVFDLYHQSYEIVLEQLTKEKEVIMKAKKRENPIMQVNVGQKSVIANNLALLIAFLRFRMAE